MKRILTELGIKDLNKVMTEVKFTIDPSLSGYYGIDEFVEYFVEVCLPFLKIIIVLLCLLEMQSGEVTNQMSSKSSKVFSF
jgi:hypothetical protein